MGLLPTMHRFNLPPWFEDGGMSDMKQSSVSVLASTVLLNFIDNWKCLMAYHNVRTTKETGSWTTGERYLAAEAMALCTFGLHGYLLCRFKCIVLFKSKP